MALELTESDKEWIRVEIRDQLRTEREKMYEWVKVEIRNQLSRFKRD
jgi:hypothetical protein